MQNWVVQSLIKEGCDCINKLWWEEQIDSNTFSKILKLSRDNFRDHLRKSRLDVGLIQAETTWHDCGKSFCDDNFYAAYQENTKKDFGLNLAKDEEKKGQYWNQKRWLRVIVNDA